MNAAQIHLMFNHWPVILIAVGFFVLLYGEWRLNVPFKRLGLVLLIAAALFAVPTQFSGEGAEEVLEATGVVDNTTEYLIEKHETLGFFTAMLAYALGVLSLISLIMIHNTHKFFGYVRKFIIICAGGGIILAAITAHSGGEIRHTEIRWGSTTSIQPDMDTHDDD